MKVINYFVLFIALLLAPILKSAPTNDPALLSGSLFSVMVSSNGVLSKPSNFISTNKILTFSNLLVGSNMVFTTNGSSLTVSSTGILYLPGSGIVFTTNIDGSITITSTGGGGSGNVSFTNFDNVTILTNGYLRVDTNIIATTNWVISQGYVTSSITNGLAGTNQIYTLIAGSGVNISTNGWELTFSGDTNVLATRLFLTNYINSATNGFVTSSITNGLASTNLIYSVISGLGLSASTNSWIVTFTVDTNTIASREFVTNYVSSATNGFVTSSITNGLAGTNLIYSIIFSNFLYASTNGNTVIVTGPSTNNFVLTNDSRVLSMTGQNLRNLYSVVEEATIYLDASKPEQNLLVTDLSLTDLAFNTTNRYSGVCYLSLKLNQIITNSVNVTFNTNWTWIGSAPSTVSSNDPVWILLRFDGDSETNVMAVNLGTGSSGTNYFFNNDQFEPTTGGAETNLTVSGYLRLLGLTPGLYLGLDGSYNVISTNGPSGVTVAAGTNIVTETNGNIITVNAAVQSFDTNQPHITLTNGMNLLTNGTLTLYGVGYGDGSNYRRLRIGATGNDFYLGTETAGTGVGDGDLFFATQSTNRWQITPTGNLICPADNTYDIGASGATRPRHVYAAGTLYAANTYFLGGGASQPVQFYADANGRMILRGSSAGDWKLLGFEHTRGDLGINTTNGTFSFGLYSDVNNTNPFVVISPTDGTNYMRGTTTITNLQHGTIDAQHTYIPTTTNLVWYIDMSLPAQTIDITNVGLASITFHTTNRPSSTNVMRTSVVRLRQTATNSLPLTFNSGWTNFFGAPPPTALATNVWGMLSMSCFGPDETNVLAGYTVQPY